MSFRLRYPHEEITERALEGELVTAVKGNLGYFDSSGFAEECASNAVNVDFIFAEDAHDSTTDGDDYIRIWRLKPGVQYSCKDVGATEQTDIGQLFALVVTDSVHYCDTTEKGYDIMKVVGHDPRQAIGTEGGRVFVEFLSAIMETEA